MNTQHTDSMWLDEHHEVSLDELIELSGLSIKELQNLLESGVLVPNNKEEAIWHFKSHYLVSIRALSRLKQDFELEPNAFALTLVFLERIRTLEFQLRGSMNPISAG
ncbi:MAG: chaperone modulator CbpM [Methylophilaceae bacterium]|nr:chaperone modulator CbpM [Methyloradius sp.]